MTVRPQELEQHFAQELDRLYKVSSTTPRPRSSRSSGPAGHPQDHPHAPLLHAPSAADGTPQGRWETYKRIKANRQVRNIEEQSIIKGFPIPKRKENVAKERDKFLFLPFCFFNQARIRVKNRKRKADEPSCPVCSERLSGTPEELNQHVERCLNKHNGNPAGQNPGIDDEEVDVEGDPETFEEYEWAGQRRVRATSMLVGGFSGESQSQNNDTSIRTFDILFLKAFFFELIYS